MSVKTNECNKLIKFTTKIRTTHLDIKFLKNCVKHRVTPKFVQLKLNPKLMKNKKLLQCLIYKCLKHEIAQHYIKLDILKRKTYHLHLIISNSLNYYEWNELDLKLHRTVAKKEQTKRLTLNKKLQNLILNNTTPPQATQEQLCIKNMSTTTFTETELKLLNKGLKFALKPKNLPLEDLVCDLHEAALKLTKGVAPVFINEAEKLFKNMKNNKTIIEDRTTHKTLKMLKEKDVIYTKADKGNAVVILDKNDYIKHVEHMIDTGPYKPVKKDPLQIYIRNVKSTIKNCPNLIDSKLKNKLINTNPKLPHLYALPKIHKPELSFRPIVSNINSPTYNIAKWLSNKFNKLKFQNSFSIKNTKELISKLNNISVNTGDKLISFDVVSLFPNVPISDTLNILHSFLIYNDIPQEEIDEYLLLTKLCMEQNTFTFYNKFHQQSFGTSMGNPLSPFLADLFLNNLENTTKASYPKFPKFWARYVDDVFAVIPADFDIDDFLNFINNQYRTIKFTYEIEKDKSLPFLDLKITITKENKFQYDIYRKPTHTDNYIHKDSYCYDKYKQATFYFLLHRANDIPLSEENYKKELDYIYTVGINNGYNRSYIDKIKHKIDRRRLNRSLTQLQPDDTKKKIYCKIIFSTVWQNKVNKLFRNFNLIPAFTNNSTLRTYLNEKVDNIEPLKKSGIYKINCNSCNKFYIGQTTRNPEIRFKEHMYHLKNHNIDKSALALHYTNTGHRFKIDDVELIKHSSRKSLDMLEAIHINKHKNSLINIDLTPTQFKLLQILPQ